MRLQVMSEVEELKSNGAFERVPKQALPALLGESTSCWTMTLEESKPSRFVPESEKALRHVERKLVELGTSVRGAGGKMLGFSITSRTAAVVHHSKSPQDRGAPPMIDEREAVLYIEGCREKKVVALYYFGPGKATLRLVLREDPKRVFEATIEEECILLYRTDAVKLNIEAEEHEKVVIVQMDFLGLCRQNLAQRSLETLAAPEDLQKWYDDRLLHYLSNDLEGEIPYRMMKEACVFQKRENVPVRIVKSWHELPRLAFFDGSTSPFEATLLGGQDCVTEIVSKVDGNRLTSGADPAVFGAKWNMEEYYDEDPDNVGSMKMYTRHLAVLNRGHDAEDDFNLQKFKVTHMENFNFDPKQRMVCEATYELFTSVGIDLDAGSRHHLIQSDPDADIRGKEVGHFVGISGVNDMYLNFITRDATINKFSWTNLGTGAMVARLAFIFGTCGPCVAVDTEDSSGSAALETAATNLRSGKCSPFAVASGVSLISHPVQIIMLCAANLISRSGRSKVFDESCDGFAKGEGVVSTFLELHEEADTSKEIMRKAPLDIPRRGGKSTRDCIEALIVGTAVNSLGVSAALNAPSIHSLQQLLDKSCSDANTNFRYVDAVEVHAGGLRIGDQIEVGALASRLRHRDPEAPAVFLRPHKTHYGNMGAPSGLAALCRTCALLRKGLHGPQIHLKQLLDMTSILENDEEAPSRIQFLTEAIQSHGPKQLVGVNSFSTTGTNISMLIAGHVPHLTQAVSGRRVSWFPAGKTNVAQSVLRGFFIVGSWTNFQSADLMEEEAEGVYAYTMTLGENRFETFQIWMDEDSDNVYHPLHSRDCKNSKVVYSSPDHTNVQQGPLNEKRCWLVDGREQPTRLLNEEQYAKLKDEKLGQKDKLEGYAIAYLGNHIPPECEGDGSIESMPLVELNTEDVGVPGDKYRIRFSTRGKYFNVSWSKLAGDVAKEDSASYTHKYQIIGDHSDWFFEDMDGTSDASGSYSKVIQLKRARSKFQVYRDRDWEQCLYPEIDNGGMSSNILGPDGDGFGKYWLIEGEVGDIVRVKFQRLHHEGRETRQITWAKEAFKTVDLQEIENSQKWHICGSFSTYHGTVEMKRDEQGNHYGDFVIGFNGVETFQLLLNGNFLCALYPCEDNGTMFDEAGAMQGPGPDGTDKFWSVGSHPEDMVSRGTIARIHLDIEGGLPKRVWWERYDTDDSHRFYLAQGAWNTMDRHCRMLGFVPYHAKYATPAKMVGRPNFLNVRAGETKTSTKSIPGPGLEAGVNYPHPLEGKVIG